MNIDPFLLWVENTTLSRWLVESPSLLRLEVLEDASRHVVLQKTARIAEPKFYELLRRRVEQSARRELFVFVHGFNNRFDDAVYRFAQIVHDSKAPAIPVLFTWPSRGETKLRAYTYDRESANYSRDALEDFNLRFMEPLISRNGSHRE